MYLGQQDNAETPEKSKNERMLEFLEQNIT